MLTGGASKFLRVLWWIHGRQQNADLLHHLRRVASGSCNICAIIRVGSMASRRISLHIPPKPRALQTTFQDGVLCLLKLFRKTS